jgi:galactokinase
MSTSMREFHAEAPGRVNLIGEHTDYQDGFVLPSAVPQHTEVVLQVRGDRMVHASSAELGAPVEYELSREQPGKGWGDYLQGVTWALAQQGVRIGGFELRIRSDVPIGSGLSSSAALEVATLRALRAAFDIDLPDVALAQTAQRAEVEFVGVPVGIMDQMAASLAGEHEALFLDTRSLYFERIPFPPNLDLVVIDSGVAHRHASGEYVTRRREADEAAQQLGVRRLRDVTVDQLARLDGLPPVLARRARHIVRENQRVIEARESLLSGDLPRLGRLFHASHLSLRDDYEVSVAAVDRLVESAMADRDVFGARMTGGGFGGAVVVAAAAGTGREVARRVADTYRQTGGRPHILVPTS